MTKQDLRLDYKKRRNNISPQSLANASLSIAKNVLRIPIWDYTYYHIFLSIAEKKEPDTSYILSILQGKNKKIVLPKVSGNTLSNYLFDENTHLITNKWHIPEPIEGVEVPAEHIDVVFVPLLAFDKIGNRVGYGKGFYDSFLGNCKAEVIKVGISLFGPAEEVSDIFEKDIALDYCVTPEKNYSFKTD